MAPADATQHSSSKENDDAQDPNKIGGNT